MTTCRVRFVSVEAALQELENHGYPQAVEKMQQGQNIIVLRGVKYEILWYGPGRGKAWKEYLY